MARVSVFAALGGLAVSLTLVCGCGGSTLPCTTGAPSCVPPITNPGSSVTSSGSPVSTPASVQCESLSPGGNDATEMSSWVHWNGHSFSAFLPTDQWQKPESMSGVDLSSPTGDADASFAYITVGPAPYSTSQLEQITLGNIFATYQIVADSHPFSFANGTRESYEFTASGSHGAAQGNAHGCLTVDSIATAAGGYGGDTYVYFSTQSTWGQYEHVLHLVLAHLTFQGRNVNG